MATVERLKQLRDQYDIRSADKLRKAALANGLRPKAADLVAALSEDVARQVFAPAPRSDMKSAAEQPGSRLQADLMDFSKKRQKCGQRQSTVRRANHGRVHAPDLDQSGQGQERGLGPEAISQRGLPQFVRAAYVVLVPQLL